MVKIKHPTAKLYYYLGLRIDFLHPKCVEVEFILPRGKTVVESFDSLWSARKAIIEWSKRSDWNRRFARGEF